MISIFTGVFVKLLYLIVSLIVGGASYDFFVNARIPSPVAAILSFLAFIACLAVLFPKVREVLSEIVETVRDLS